MSAIATPRLLNEPFSTSLMPAAGGSLPSKRVADLSEKRFYIREALHAVIIGPSGRGIGSHGSSIPIFSSWSGVLELQRRPPL